MTEGTQIHRLAIVDDQRLDQKIYRRLVDRSGLVGELLTFFSGREALDHLKATGQPAIDVLLVDLRMPEMTGLEFLAQVHETKGKKAATSIYLMITSELSVEEAESVAEAAYIDGVLRKPLSISDLEQMAEKTNAKT